MASTTLKKRYAQDLHGHRNSRIETYVSRAASITNVTSSWINNQAGFLLSPSSPRSESGSPSSGRALADCGVSCHTTSGPADNSSIGERKDVNPKVGSTSQTVQSLSSRMC